MLKQISIKNFAIFSDATLEPDFGYNVITGESGSGKSIIVNALSLIRGARAYKEMIRTGCDYAIVEAVFELTPQKMELIGFDENILVITRRINLEKSSECRINGKIRPLSEVVEITGHLIDIHGQYENQTLADSENHLGYLDSFAGEKLYNVLQEYRDKLGDYSKLTKDVLALSGSEGERERNREIYSFQIKEIDEAGLSDISESELFEMWNVMKNAEQFRIETQKSFTLLENDEKSPYDLLIEAKKILDSLPENQKLSKIIKKMDDAAYQILDSVADLRDFTNEITFDKYEFDRINDTLDNLKKLKRKYGRTLDDILKFRNKIADELETIENFEINNTKMLEQLGILEKELLDLNEQMLAIRNNNATDLRKKLLAELNEMAMYDSEIIINIVEKKPKNGLGYIDFGLNGIVSCEFLITLNKGLEPQSLGKVASGGEMSRIMLAFKTISTIKDETETVVFDEIDSGLSGEASRTVATKLSLLAKKRQIICITHLPQITARPGSHFIIRKESNNKITSATINRTNGEESIIRQIASLTDGDNITKEALKHAENLYKQYN